MHSNNFVLSIKDNNGNSLRENKSGEVFLPFGSEYKLYLKNNNWQRALIKVSIDGTDVTGPGIVLNGQGSIDLERFVADGNLTSGKKFKFVSVNDPAVADPSNLENGVVKVQFTLEKFVPWTITTTCPPITVWYPPIEIKPYDPHEYKWVPNVTWCKTNVAGGGAANFMSGCSSTHNIKAASTVTSGNMGNAQSMYSAQMNPSQAGATVEGGQSGQSFGTTYLNELETVTTTLVLKLLAPAGIAVPLTSSDTKKVHCSSCNSKVRWDDSFCWKCGSRLIHQELTKG